MVTEMKGTVAIDPSDKLARLIKHSTRLVQKQDEVRKVIREAIARTVEERLRAQNGGYLRLREYEYMLSFALRQALLETSPPEKQHPQKSRNDSELFNALVDKLLQDVETNKESFK